MSLCVEIALLSGKRTTLEAEPSTSTDELRVRASEALGVKGRLCGPSGADLGALGSETTLEQAGFLS